MKFATKLSLGCIALLSCALGAAGLLLTGQSFSGSLTSTRTALQAQQDKEKYALERIIFQATDSVQFENYILASAAQQYAEQTAGELADSARSMWEDFTLPATPESARTAHGQPSPPAYARTDSYTPGFPLQFPLPGQSRKTSGYGWRTDPMGGLGDDFHIGNDLAAAQGTPVLAAADGVVRMAGSHKSYGNYLRILHADGDETLYAHMQYLFVKAGECVTAGQSLGTVGETGNATGPHLHFEILHRGLRYDPAEALQNAS